MPATFQPDTLRDGLLPSSARQPLDSQAQRYRDVYRLPRGEALDSWMWRFSVLGFDVVAQAWHPADATATVVLIHGFYDHVGLYRHVIDWALARGFAVIACDLPGHGLSSGARASIGDFAEYQAVLDQLFVEARQLQLPQPWHLCGQSMGGAIVVDHLLHAGADSPAQGRPILLAPLVRPRAWGWSHLSYRLLKPFVDGIPRRFSENTHDPDFMPFLRADPLQPLRLPTAWVGALVPWITRIEAAPASDRSPLIVQGEQDTTVDWRHNLRVLRGKFRQPEVLLLPTARHHLANESADIRQVYFAFLDTHLR